MEKKSFSERISDKFHTLKPEAAPQKDLLNNALAADEHEKRQGILNRMHSLRQTLCRVNCKPLLHRPSCKAMKKDIEYLKEIIL